MAEKELSRLTHEIPLTYLDLCVIFFDAICLYHILKNL